MSSYLHDICRSEMAFEMGKTCVAGLACVHRELIGSLETKKMEADLNGSLQSFSNWNPALAPFLMTLIEERSF